MSFESRRNVSHVHPICYLCKDGTIVSRPALLDDSGPLRICRAVWESRWTIFPSKKIELNLKYFSKTDVCRNPCECIWQQWGQRPLTAFTSCLKLRKMVSRWNLARWMCKNSRWQILRLSEATKEGVTGRRVVEGRLDSRLYLRCVV